MNLLFHFIFKIRFESSKFEFNEEQFGDITDHKCWLNDSLILYKEESSSLVEMTKSNKGILLYRATRDGFGAKDFHSKCDGKANTITIIKNNLNYVFGGYASEPWNSSFEDEIDSNAFLFSLRRDGKSYNDKFTFKNDNEYKFFLIGDENYGPIFGHELFIWDKSNIETGSSTNFDFSLFNVPVGFYIDKNEENVLAGWTNTDWATTEIEVYEISN